MNKFFQNFSSRLQKFGILKIAILAIAIRFILAVPFYSGDLNNPAIWGIYAKEFGFSGFYDFLNFGNYSRPDYPPVAIILFWFIRSIWVILFKFFWWINVSIPFFPSNFIVWLEHDGYNFLLKLPGLICDFLLGYLIYKFFSKKDKRKALLASAIYWFNPATVYVSSMWGQVDGIVMLTGFYAILKAIDQKFTLVFFILTLSFLMKPTMLMLIPVIILLVFINKTSLKNIILSLIPSIVLIYLVSYPFAPWGPFPWFFRQYFKNFLNIASNLPYIQVSAFNFWTLVSGSRFLPLTTTFLGIKLSIYAYALFLINFVLIFYLALKKKNVFGAVSLFIFSSFLFLPKIHERYLLPIIPFLVIYCLESWSKKKKKLLLFICLFLFLNLYSAWGVPKSFIVDIFRIDIIARLTALALIFMYIYHLKIYNEQK